MSSVLVDAPRYTFTLAEGLITDLPYFNTTIHWGGWFPYLATFGTTVAYLFCIYVLFPAIKPSKEVLAVISKYHYIGLFLYSTLACVGTLYHMVSSGEISDYQSYLCKPLPGWYHLLSLSFTVSKIWEWLDTAILIWRGQSLQKIGFLHCYHHATTVFCFLHTAATPGANKVGLLLNGFVHSLMYYHYAFRLPMFVRPLITGAQIIQLMTGTFIWSEVSRNCAAYSDFLQREPFAYLVPYLFVPVYLLFFIRFFAEQYICKKPRTPAAATGSTKDAVKQSERSYPHATPSGAGSPISPVPVVGGKAGGASKKLD